MSGTSAEATPIAVRARDVAKVYPGASAGATLGHVLRRLVGRAPRGTTALDGIDFALAPGQALGIVGRNGSGKSTLLQILAGALAPTRGDVRIEGRVGTLLDLTAGINPDYTGAENALVLGMLAGLSRREARDRLEEVRAFSGLADAFDRPVKGYSSGMAMRLGFSAAILADPDVLLIDEALAVGDAFYQQRCLRKMRELRDLGTTIVLVSHDPSAVISLCDRALWLEQGRVQTSGDPKDVLRQYLAARYTDDCDLHAGMAPVASLVEVEAEAEPIRAARPIERFDERFGNGHARIAGFELRDAAGRAAATIRPGEPAELVVSVSAAAAIESPLIGFTMRNRLGDVVTATNTELEGVALPPMAEDDTLDVAFRLPWPALAGGSVALSPAIADGCIAAHAMCDWVENALVVEVENEKGLFGWLTLDGVGVGVGPLGRADASAADPTAEKERTPAADARRPATNQEGAEAPADRGEDMEDHIEFSLDEPRDPRIEPGQITGEHELLFSGWSFAASGEPVEVAIRVDGCEERRVGTTGFRDDVGRAYGDVRHASRSGFAAMVPLPRRVGSTRCQVEVSTPTTSRVAAEFELELPPGPVRVDEASPPPAAQPARRRSGPPRLLFVTHSFNLEGAPRSLFETARGVVLGDFDGCVVSPVAGPLEAEWKDAGFETRILPVDVRVPGRDDYDAMIRRLAALLSVTRPDLVVANTLETFWAVHVARELGVPCVWIVRESEDPASYFHTRLPTAIAERGVDALDVADRVVFVADATRALFRTRLPDTRSLVIPNGLDLGRIDGDVASEQVARIRHDHGIAPDVPIILCVGTPCTRKGQLELLDALVHLSARGLDFHCVFLGVGESDYVDRMRARIAEGGLASRVSLVPPTSEPLDYFAAADVVVCPSFQESLPRVVMEAMAFARPIVATRVFGVPEMIRDGREGRLVEAGDTLALADALQEVAADRGLAAALGERARERVREQFSLRRTVEGYASLFRRLLESTGDALDAQGQGRA